MFGGWTSTRHLLEEHQIEMADLRLHGQLLLFPIEGLTAEHLVFGLSSTLFQVTLKGSFCGPSDDLSMLEVFSSLKGKGIDFNHL